MNLIRVAISRPIAVIAAVFMVLIFGFLALQRIPIQLTPDVRKPTLSVTTYWYGGAPIEVEREVVNRQEEQLKGLEGLASMESNSQDGQAEITLEFNLDVSMDRSLLLVSNRLNQISGYPEEVDEPTISTAGLDDNPIAWFILTRTSGNNRPIDTYGDFVEDNIKDRLERVAGVSRSNVYGGAEREMRVIVDPEKMARYHLTVPEVVTALRLANASYSAGDVKEGKRRYVVRADGEFETPEDVRQVVLRSPGSAAAAGGMGRVTVDNIADVHFAYKEASANIRFLGEPAMAINAVRDTGANVIETMEGIHEAIDEMNQTILPQAGLKLEQVYNETVYINSAIDLVVQNIWMGGLLAAAILMLFLRSWRATLIVSMAIPISVVASFVAMAALGRSLNVISLAGIAFAVGMVVDAAIVVLENVYRLRERGMSAPEAAYHGAQQVWGAVLVSALTTVLVFVPILVMELEAGQLFRDIAVAVSTAVLMSLLVSITVIPALSKTLLKGGRSEEGETAAMRRYPLPGFDNFARAFVGVMLGYTRRIVRSKSASTAVVLVLVLGTGAAAWIFLPKLEYLPEGNRNLVFGIMLPPPGYNLETMTEIGERIEDQVKPMWARVSGPESEPGQPPKIDNFFFVATRRGQTFFGATAIEADRAGELVPVLTRTLFGEPGTFGVFTQPSLFSRGLTGGRTIELDVSGPDLADVIGVAQQAFGIISQKMPRTEGNQARPIPGLELGSPEVRAVPDRLKLADNGVTAQAMGESVDAFNSGLRVAEITVDGRRIDLTLQGPEDDIVNTQGIGFLPIVTASGNIVPLNSLAHVDVTAGPTEVRHVERERTITIEVKPSPTLALESAIDLIQSDVIDALKAGGLPPGVRMRMAGTADELTKTWNAMVVNLLVAIVIVYLLMAVLFESFVYPMIIMLSVPLAAAGGVAGLALLNTFQFQALDMLTMLGFVILIGIVVNNAILLVHQTLFHLRSEGMERDAAIVEAVQNRMRPIFMSTLTSVFGMLPLVVIPGAGSELYRGLGSVVVGGLSLSAVLTLVIVPPLLAIFVRKDEVAAAEGEGTPLAQAAE